MTPISVFLVPYYYTCDPQEQRPYCLNYTNTSGELAVTRFTYNRRGLNDKSFYQQITGNRSSQNSQEFDKSKRLVRKFRKYNDGETSEELFTYDKDGRLVSESFESSNGSSGEAHYEYDKKGNAVKMICKGYKGWLDGMVGFDFDSAGKRLAGRIIKDGKAAGSIEYQYDKTGNLVHEHWVLGNNEWSQTLKYVYEQATNS